MPATVTLLGPVLLALAAFWGLSAAQQRECECVDYFLCEQGRIVTDGSNLLDIRQKACPGVEVCCLPPDIVLPSTSTQSPDDLPLTPTVRQNPSTRPTPAPPTGDQNRLEIPSVAPGGGCGRRRLPPGTQLKVTGNNGPPERTFYGEAPWMVVLLRQQSGTLVFTCGGTLVTPSIVLTAAHCINGSESELQVRAGEYDNRFPNKPLPVQTRRVSRVSVHPQYNSANLQNDIALVFLESPMQLNEVIDVICGPEAGADVNPKGCFVTGWGRNSSQGRYQSALSKVYLELRDRDYCQNLLRTSRLGKHFQLHEGFVCAGGGDNRDTCAGDGGGPLVCPSINDANKLIQVGVVTWGIGCGEGYPTVLTSVSYYLRWISSQIS